MYPGRVKVYPGEYMTSDIKIRHSLLRQARSLLFRHWEEKVFVEHAAALFENRPPKVVAPPTTRKIMKVAEELYGFVQGSENRDAPPAVTVELSEAVSE